MQLALDDAGLKPADIGYINAHGTSTQLNDKSETLAVKKVFGEQAYQVPISSTKSVTGHLLGASGSLEAVICAKVLNEKMLPPTMNYEFPDPECDLDYVPNVARAAAPAHVMSNSFGFGGHNATLILSQASGLKSRAGTTRGGSTRSGPEKDHLCHTHISRAGGWPCRTPC